MEISPSVQRTFQSLIARSVQQDPMKSIISDVESFCTTPLYLVGGYLYRTLVYEMFGIEKTKSADILIVAAGKPNLITADHLSTHQTVIDVGINPITQNKVRPSNGLSEKPESELPKTKFVGDVNYKEVSKKVAAISPVPGGVGPMTVASLFQNLLEAYQKQT